MTTNITSKNLVIQELVVFHFEKIIKHIWSILIKFVDGIFKIFLKVISPSKNALSKIEVNDKIPHLV